MEFDEYQKQAHKTAQYKNDFYVPLAIAGEVGELLNYMAKYYRGDFDEIDTNKIKYEVGDILWELSELLTINNISLNEVAEMNIKKLKEREQKGTIKGSGDYR